RAGAVRRGPATPRTSSPPAPRGIGAGDGASDGRGGRGALTLWGRAVLQTTVRPQRFARFAVGADRASGGPDVVRGERVGMRTRSGPSGFNLARMGPESRIEEVVTGRSGAAREPPAPRTRVRVGRTSQRSWPRRQNDALTRFLRVN